MALFTNNQYPIIRTAVGDPTGAPPREQAPLGSGIKPQRNTAQATPSRGLDGLPTREAPAQTGMSPFIQGPDDPRLKALAGLITGLQNRPSAPVREATPTTAQAAPARGSIFSGLQPEVLTLPQPLIAEEDDMNARIRNFLATYLPMSLGISPLAAPTRQPPQAGGDIFYR